MPVRGTFTLPSTARSFEKLGEAMQPNQKRPPIGVTQGGSSRRGGGAKPAATDGLFRPQKRTS